MTASITVKHAVRQREVLLDPPAPGAGFGCGLEAGDHEQLYAIPGALVLKLPSELAHGGVSDGSGEPPVLHHTGHVQVLDADYQRPHLWWLGFRHHHSGRLVDGIGADTGNTVVLPCYLSLRYLPSGRAFHLTGQLLL